MFRRLVSATLGLCLGVGVLLLTGCNGSMGNVVEVANKGAPPGTGFISRTLVTADHSRKYTVFVPHNYNPAQRYPAIVFLHGIGEAGSDADANLHVGIGPLVARRAADFPFIVVFPQSTGDWSPDSQNAADAIATLEQCKRDYAIDADRVFLTGLSTGGYGTWAIGAKYRTEFAALVPMCAYAAKDDQIPELAKIPVWCFHNTLDPFVMAAGDHSTCDAINKAGGNAKYTEYLGLGQGHDCWDRAYNEGELFTWMLAQRRNAAMQPMTPRASTRVPAAVPVVPAPVSVSGRGAETPMTPY